MTKALWLLVAVAASLAAGFWAAMVVLPREPDFADKAKWTPIRSFDGILNPSDGIVHVDVYVIDSLMDGPTSDPTWQNIIELTSSSRSAQFRWSSSTDFAAGWCEIADLDGDGWNELVFLRRAVGRVVSYRDGAFSFRDKRDEILSGERVRTIDVDGDGQLEFVLDGPLLLGASQAAGQISKRVPVWKWKRELGFEKAFDDLPTRYLETLRR